eukprot:7045906-Lingulodinium_polyedra.AAC.1
MRPSDNAGVPHAYRVALRVVKFETSRPVFAYRVGFTLWGSRERRATRKQRAFATRAGCDA